MKINLDKIKAEAAEYGWTVISDKYVNLDTDMTFECNEGHTVFLPYKKVRDKWSCPSCVANKYIEPSHNPKQKAAGVRRILALDQASYVTGYAIFDDKELVDYGTFETSLGDEIARINMIKMWLVSMIQKWRPDFIGIEGIQYEQHFGVKTFQTLGRLQGVLMECCFEQKIPYEVCPTNTWRHHCGVKGRSRVDRKQSMKHIIKEMYDISVSDDIADAIGIGKYVSEAIVTKSDIVQWE